VSRRTTYLAPSASPAVGIVAVMPLLVAYELAVLLAPDRSQATVGLLLRRLFALLGPSGFLLFNAALAAGCLLAVRAKVRDRVTRRFDLYPLLILEGIAYGALLGPVTLRLLGLPHALAAGGDAHDLALGAGAAVYEELLFRLVLIGGGLALLRGKRPVDRMLTGAILVVASSAAFSLFHHLGPGAEPFEIRTALFRFVAGMVLGGVFLLRGFGVAAYTHAAYNAFLVLGAP
jgi:hypothetical protein